jgi:hypothetical protein
MVRAFVGECAPVTHEPDLGVNYLTDARCCLQKVRSVSGSWPVRLWPSPIALAVLGLVT